MRLPTPLLVITDRKTARQPLDETLAASFAGGLRWVMVREKDLAPPALADLVRDIVGLACPAGATVSVNGNAAVAHRCGAGGVHLPQGHDVATARRIVGNAALVGVSAHSLDEARAAQDQGADYVTLSPIFPSVSKPGYGPALGLDGLSRFAAAIAIPVVALGGVGAANAADCLAAGAAGVAVLGAVMRANDPAQAVAEMMTAMAAAPETSHSGR